MLDVDIKTFYSLIILAFAGVGRKINRRPDMQSTQSFRSRVLYLTRTSWAAVAGLLGRRSRFEHASASFPSAKIQLSMSIDLDLRLSEHS